MADIIVRPAIPEEADAILRLTQDAFAAHRAVLDPPSGVFRETTADVEQAMIEGTVYVALRDGALVGVARVHPLDDPCALYCGRLAVAPAAQGSGIGSALMDAMERHAREAGYPAAVVGVRTQLPHNRRFFEQRGYRVYAEHSHSGYAHPTYVRLRKDLVDPA